MICSMTAFARAEEKNQQVNLTCELRSINHRFLEMNFYLPDFLRALETPLRDCLKSFFKRGKIDCAIRYQSNLTGTATSSFNHNHANAFVMAAEVIASLLKNPAPISPTDILRIPGVLESPEVDIESMQSMVLTLVKAAAKDLFAAREREGLALCKLFLERMGLLDVQIQKIKAHLPDIFQQQYARMQKRFSEAKLELEPQRLEQEMLLYTQKIDISEEIDRLQTHILEVRRVLKEGGAVGRRLDFLLQELNREANTIGSKSADSETSHAAVEMKVIIEQVREQVQNIE